MPSLPWNPPPIFSFLPRPLPRPGGRCLCRRVRWDTTREMSCSPAQLRSGDDAPHEAHSGIASSERGSLDCRLGPADCSSEVATARRGVRARKRVRKRVRKRRSGSHLSRSRNIRAPVVVFLNGEGSREDLWKFLDPGPTFFKKGVDSRRFVPYRCAPLSKGWDVQPDLTSVGERPTI